LLKNVVKGGGVVHLKAKIVIVLLAAVAVAVGIMIFQGWEEHGSKERASYRAGILEAFSNGNYDAALPGLVAMADEGSAIAQANLAFLYERGLAVERDAAKALKFYSAAADRGHRGAKLALARLLEEEGPPQNRSLVSSYYRELAASGSTEAAIRLASFHFEGTGLPQDYVAAAQWLTRAARAGDPEAQLRLGLMYRDGLGVPQDIIFAHMWLNLAAARFSAAESGRRAEAVAARDALAPQMTAEELRESLQVAREWHSANS
jgi:uncharacterized protein